jgi:hypothetical protein
VLREQSGKEPLSGGRNFGPDTDKNYGYEGVLYLTALLELKYGSRLDPGRRAAALGESKRAIAKLFGLGKSSKAKPGPLLEKARDLYDNLNKESTRPMTEEGAPSRTQHRCSWPTPARFLGWQRLDAIGVQGEIEKALAV